MLLLQLQVKLQKTERLMQLQGKKQQTRYRQRYSVVSK